MMRLVRYAVVLACSTLTAIGCGQSSDRVSIRGGVTYQGQAIDSAALTFFPASGPPVTVPVVDGDYRAALPPANYQVTVRVGTKLPAGWKEGDPVPPPEFNLPPQYTQRTRTELTATVASDQTAPIDFELK